METNWVRIKRFLDSGNSVRLFLAVIAFSSIEFFTYLTIFGYPFYLLDAYAVVQHVFVASLYFSGAAGMATFLQRYAENGWSAAMLERFSYELAPGLPSIPLMQVSIFSVLFLLGYGGWYLLFSGLFVGTFSVWLLKVVPRTEFLTKSLPALLLVLAFATGYFRSIHVAASDRVCIPGYNDVTILIATAADGPIIWIPATKTVALFPWANVEAIHTPNNYLLGGSLNLAFTFSPEQTTEYYEDQPNNEVCRLPRSD